MNRILLQLDHEANRRLLADWLAPHYQVLLGSGPALLAEAYDLCIFDAPALNRLRHQIEVRKARERPLFLPFLVVIPHRHGHLITGSLRRCVDELITSPVEKTELLLRLENLMRIRQLSLELEAANARLKRNLSQMEGEEEGGRQIQFQLLPEREKVLGGYTFSRELITSAYLSGDFVDYFAIDDRHLGFYMADVSGHGVSSAFVTVLLKSYMTRYLEDYREKGDPMILHPEEVLSRLNHTLFGVHLGKYLTMFYGVLNRADNRLRYCHGGQFPFPILFDGTRPAYIGTKSLPVGLFDFARYQAHTQTLPPRFTLALISDGILEVLPPPRLRDKLAQLLSLMAKDPEGIDPLIRESGLSQDRPPPDDITFLMIRRQ
jgi:serine phosphatase RsbU (regulator of sigma subunit)